jgi:type IV pilus assembly protein PilM
MSILAKLKHLIQDPPPACVFEFSEAGIAYCFTNDGAASSFQPLEPGALKPSPLADNFVDPQAIHTALARISPVDPQRKRPAALLLPDYASRLAVLDFDSFPHERAEQESLVRFRLKKSVPFDLDSAAVQYHVQPVGKGSRSDVLAATISTEVLARYEAALRQVGFQPGIVTTSSLAAVELIDGTGIQIFAKLTGPVLTVLAVENGAVKLVRCVETDLATDDEILSILFPTLAFVADELGGPAQRIVHCGFGPQPSWADRVGVAAQPLLSRFGPAGPHQAGLAGMLERIAA